MAAFKDSQKLGAGAYTSNTMVGRPMRTGDPATDPKVGSTKEPKTAPKIKADKLHSIAKDLDVCEGCCPNPIVNGAGGYKPVTRAGGRRYEPL